MYNINVGSIVTIIDESYMLSVDGCYIKDSTELSKGFFIVLEINKPFPTKETDSKFLIYQNNCKIKNISTGKEWYCSRLNIKADNAYNYKLEIVPESYMLVRIK